MNRIDYEHPVHVLRGAEPGSEKSPWLTKAKVRWLDEHHWRAALNCAAQREPRVIMCKICAELCACAVVVTLGAPPPSLTVLRRFETQLFLSSVPRLLEHQAELSTTLTENDHHYRNLNKNLNNI